jgi:hypothetical protein
LDITNRVQSCLKKSDTHDVDPYVRGLDEKVYGTKRERWKKERVL